MANKIIYKYLCMYVFKEMFVQNTKKNRKTDEANGKWETSVAIIQ